MAADAIGFEVQDDAGTVTKTYYLPLNKLDATAAPGAGDDDADGFVAGSVWVDRANNKVYVCADNATGAAVWLEVAGAGAGSIDEQAQDAVGGIWVDTDTINFTYTDATPEMKADVRVQMTVTSDASGLKLVNDATTPGATKYYGTNGAGTKGWHSFPASPPPPPPPPGTYGAGGWKAPCDLATTADITLSGGTGVDGATTVTGQRILVKDQTNPAENGIYVSTGAGGGNWSRADDCATAASLAGAVTCILDGFTNKGTMWQCTDHPTVIDVDDVVWSQRT